MKVFVTGSSGFIGSHVCDKFIKEGYQVVGLDKKPNLYSQKIEFHQKDLRDITREELTALMKDVDACVHNAAQIDVRKSIENPCEDLLENIEVTVKLLECCVEAGVKRFIFASSGGAINGTEFPSSPYGIAKLSAEKYIHFFQQHHGLETVVLRYSNVYGPRQTGGVCSIFSRKMLKNETVEINGGNQTRDFVYVKDVAEANNAALTCKPGIYNISSGSSISILEIANIMKSLCLSKSKFNMKKTIPGEVMESCLEPDAPGGWKASTPLETGLIETIRYFRS